MGVDILSKQVTLSGCVPTEREISANVLNTDLVKRSLFGPVDHQEAMAFFQKELAKIEQEKMEEWNFDFANGRPLPGEFQWEKVDEKRSCVKSYKPVIRNTLNKVTKLKSSRRYSLKSVKSLPIRINHDRVNSDCRQAIITEYMNISKKLIGNHMDIKSIRSKRNLKK